VSVCTVIPIHISSSTAEFNTMEEGHYRMAISNRRMKITGQFEVSWSSCVGRKLGRYHKFLDCMVPARLSAHTAVSADFYGPSQWQMMMLPCHSISYWFYVQLLGLNLKEDMGRRASWENPLTIFHTDLLKKYKMRRARCQLKGTVAWAWSPS